jgi:2-dehydropantoate 2-reductase
VIAILGPGGVGGLLAAALARAGEAVTVVARQATTEVIARDGIQVRSVALGDFHARPAAVVERLEQPVDVLFVATKATGLRDALARIAAAPGIVVPLLNGLDHLALLRERFGPARVVASVIRVESDRPAPGRIVQTSPGIRVDLAAADPALAQQLPAVVELLSRTGITARVDASESHVMWSKLVRLNALASTTSAFDLPLGAIREDAAKRRALVACVEEGTRVAIADGAGLQAGATLHELETAHPGLGSSMRRDLAAGRVPELDAIQGSVLRGAARHGLACPTVAELAGVIAARAGIDPPTV